MKPKPPIPDFAPRWDTDRHDRWEPFAWTQDCQGKQDLDGELLSLSTRFWPLFHAGSDKVQAIASLQLRVRLEARMPCGGPKDPAWRSAWFYGDTEDEVKRAVEKWARARLAEARRLLGPAKPQRKFGEPPKRAKR